MAYGLNHSHVHTSSHSAGSFTHLIPENGTTHSGDNPSQTRPQTSLTQTLGLVRLTVSVSRTPAIGVNNGESGNRHIVLPSNCLCHKRQPQGWPQGFSGPLPWMLTESLSPHASVE